jgi:uncharacterized protein YeaO (DUF488 family)
MIRTASVYDEYEPASAGMRVLVMRYWPRGVRRDRVDLWLKEAAPSAQLVNAYTHQGIGWAEFEQRYRSEILDQRPEILHQLRQLERERGTLVLLCHERIPPHEHCHREVLAELVRT